MSIKSSENERIKEQLRKRQQKKEKSSNVVDKKEKVSKNINSSGDENISNSGKVILRNLIAYSNYKKMISITVLNMLILLICIFTTYKFYIKPVPPRYIPMSQGGKIIPDIPLDKPNMNDGEIMDFSLTAVRDINMYDYENWKTQLTKTQPYFTVHGWDSYISEFQKSNTINTVRKERMVVNMTPTAPPSIIRKGEVKVDNAPPIYVWIVEIPASIKYISSVDSISKTNTISGVIRLTIIRANTIENPNGVGIQIYQFDTSRTKVAS